MNRLIRLTGLLLVLVYAGALLADPPKKEDVPKFIMELKDKDPKVRIAGCKGLASMGKVKASYTKDGIAPLMEMVKKDTDAKVRAEAAIALGSCDPEEAEAVTVLIDALKNDTDKPVRVAAATGLGQLGSKAKEALPALKEAQSQAKSDGDKGFGKALGAAINAINGKGK